MAKWTDDQVVAYYHRSFIIGSGLGVGFAFVSRGNKSWGKLGLRNGHAGQGLDIVLSLHKPGGKEACQLPYQMIQMAYHFTTVL